MTLISAAELAMHSGVAGGSDMGDRVMSSAAVVAAVATGQQPAAAPATGGLERRAWRFLRALQR